MSRGADWYGFHAQIEVVDTAEALRAALDDPTQRWYARRRVQALAATGALVGASWNPNMHPRGRDGKFIERFGWVRWLGKDGKWKSGWVRDIDPHTGEVTVRAPDGEYSFTSPKSSLYATPKPKARIDLPDPTDPTKWPSQFAKVGGQGGSNPGGMYKVVESFGADSPDLSARSGLFNQARALKQAGTYQDLGSEWDPSAPSANLVPGHDNIAIIPRIDGTDGRYDVLTKLGPNWYRVPASGSMTVDDTMRPELQVDPDEAFGTPGSPRRAKVLADLGSQAIQRGQDYEVEDVAEMFQQAGSPLPQVGDQYYVKKMNIPERARNEALANEFYELLGIPVPDVAVGKDGSTISSKVVGNTVAFDPNNPAHVAAAQDGFVADAWLSNWDVIGLSFDNIQIDADGRAWRIDAGGALSYRAQGKPKGTMFGTTVGELSSLRDKSINAQSSKVYGGVTDAQLQEQAKVLQAITPDQITALAQAHDLPDLGPVLIARRKSVLDQLGIPDPPPAPEPKATLPPKPSPSVYNPVEAVNQMGSPPAVAVSNWKQTVDNLPTATVEPGDWDNPDFAPGHVLVKDGDLWTYESGLTPGPGGTQQGLYRNLFTDERKQFTVFPGEDRYLTSHSAGNVDGLVDQMQPGRDLAVAEIVARTTNTPTDLLTAGNINKDGDPDGMWYRQTGVGNWLAFQQAWERGRLGPTGPEGATEWPIRNGNDSSMWEITAFGNDGVKLRRRDAPDQPEITLDQSDFKATGPWFIPGNDTTAAIWKSKYAPDAAEPLDVSTDPAHNPLGINTAVEAKAHLDFDPDTPTVGDAPDDGTPEANEPSSLPPDVLAAQQGNGPIPTATDALDQQIAAADPTSGSQVVTNDVLAALGPAEPILSTEITIGDMDKWQALVGKPVVVLPIEAHDNPEWEGTNLGTANGLGTVLSVETKQVYVKAAQGYGGNYQDVPALKVQKAGSSGFSWVIGGEDAKFKKVVIPVAQEPVAQQVTFKQNGDVFINGEKVGQYWKPYTHPDGYSYGAYHNYSMVIDGDHSVAGKPLQIAANKQAQLKMAAGAHIVPIAPKPTKPKSGKVTATEDEIKKLNDDLAGVQEQINLTEQQLADLAKAKPATGNPLADGSYPSKGDWVFSIKDGSYAKVTQTELNFGAKHKQSPAGYVRVEITDPDTGKKKSTLRSRNQLVAAAAPGDQPFVMQTKAVTAGDGNWVGPGTGVYNPIGGSYGVALDTTVDGKVKVLSESGGQNWVNASALSVPVHPLGGGTTAPTIKHPAGSVDADALNAQLAALNDEHAKLTAAIANTTLAKPKKKKDIGVPYPGPGGKTIVQPKWMAEQREAKGLKNMKDGYVPTPGMIVRHNDGTQYIVYEMGTDWSSHKNSVQVAPVDSPWDYKWRAVSTLTVDHDAILTDKDGNPLPIISNVEGTDWVVPSGMVLRKPFTKTWYTTDPTTGKSVYRKKEVSKFYVVSYDGTVYNMDGSQASSYAIQPGMPIERIGYIDKDHQGGKTLTLSVQPHTFGGSAGNVEYVAITDAGESPEVKLAQVNAPNPAAPTVPTPDTPAPTPAVAVGDHVTYQGQPGEILGVSESTSKVFFKPPGAGGDWVDSHEVVPSTAPPTPAPPTPTPATPTTPTVNVPEPPPAPAAPTEPTPTAAELPVFTGKSPQGSELPHPPTTASSKGIPSYQAQGGTPTLDVVGVKGAHSVTGAVAQTLDVAHQNKANGERKWVGTYGLADHDVIEDMMVRSQTVRDAQGVEYVEVSFRIEKDPARTNFNTFITSSVNEAGDWEFNGRNAKNLVPGDRVAVRVSSGGGVTPKGALRPDGELGEYRVPNAVVSAPPVLIGKNKAGTLDVYRTQITTANGDIGYIDLEDRSGNDTIPVWSWDPTKPRNTNGNKSLNPNAKADGWSVKASQMEWNRAGSGTNVSELDKDGVKKAPTTTFHTIGSYSLGAGWVLQRDYQGTHIEYSTSSVKNSLDGHTVIRVRADDPDAQRKISEAMELVGVSKEKQLPPTREAIVQMAADKIYEQFNPTYTRGMRANGGIQQALDAIDNAVGPELGRPATINDISLRMSPDGRMQVLVSEDVSRAIVKKNGIKAYTHDFMASGYEDMLEQMVSGEQVGLLSTTERWQHGLMYVGMSSAGDHTRDSADHMFLRMNSSSTANNNQIRIDPVVLHRQVDYYYQHGDSFGARGSDQLNWLNTPKVGGGNELMVQRRIEANLIGRVYLDAGARQKMLDRLHKKGITVAPNGVPLEEYFVTPGTPQKFPPAEWGTEIPLGSLPETMPTAVPTVEMAGV